MTTTNTSRGKNCRKNEKYFQIGTPQYFDYLLNKMCEKCNISP
jgi:hypothetical protein